MAARPKELSVTSTAYEDVPVEEFGAALLRGMGWRKGAPIGGSNKAVVEPHILSVRHHRLGLGALGGEGKSGGVTPGGRGGSMAPGDVVKVMGGRHRGKFAVVVQTDGVPGLNRVMVKLADASEVVSVHREGLQLLDRADRAAEELRKKHDAQLAAAAAAAEAAAAEEERRAKAEAKAARALARRRAAERVREDYGERVWLRRFIRVRIVSKSDRQCAAHYLRKAVVIAVHAETRRADLRLDDGGGVLRDVRQRHLETVLPKAEGTPVVLVAGKAKLHHATFIARDSSAEQAIVAIEGFAGGHTAFALDDVCEFVPAAADEHYRKKRERKKRRRERKADE
eukprot:PLAT12502.7.p1 GENE.PLAT12502.7~~PLAT12502.7.p1  ORF type:complete len:340 (-),score=140.24 PLAT12502.7:28-1047(-)